MAYLFSSESVSEGHPDKVADQISDALLDQFLAYDEDARCAIETFNTTGQVVIMGEVRSKEYVDLQTIARKTINNIGYTKAEYQFDGNSCGILSAIHEQSDDINRGVDNGDAENQGAGDQGMMFGYACDETDNYMPVTLDLAHLIMRTLADIRKEGKVMTYLRPDAKSQVTVEYSDDNLPQRIDTIVVSTQHDDFIKPADRSHKAQLEADKAMVEKIHEDVVDILMPRVKAQIKSEKVLDLFKEGIKYLVNPTGKFVIGGPHGDTGLTGRKIIVDTYGGMARPGGGAFSGKDPSKVDRSATYAARWVAKNVVAAGLARRCEIQVAYAIGSAHPVGVYVETFGTAAVPEERIMKAVNEVFDLRPAAIVRDLDLLRPIYRATSSYGHFGRPGFSWEATDRVEALRQAV